MRAQKRGRTRAHPPIYPIFYADYQAFPPIAAVSLAAALLLPSMCKMNTLMSSRTREEPRLHHRLALVNPATT